MYADERPGTCAGRSPFSMQHDAISAAARLLWQHWTRRHPHSATPRALPPVDRADGYAIQRRARGPLRAAASSAGRSRRRASPASVTSASTARWPAASWPTACLRRAHRVARSTGNFMRVAEAEFAFRFAASLPTRERAYGIDGGARRGRLAAPAIEIPDSRYDDFARVGAAQLIADNACACWLVVGAAAPADWRARDLAATCVQASLNGALAAAGVGANVLRRSARGADVAGERSCESTATACAAGDLVTTGTCIAPVPIAPGDVFARISGSLARLGWIRCRLTAVRSQCYGGPAEALRGGSRTSTRRCPLTPLTSCSNTAPATQFQQQLPRRLPALEIDVRGRGVGQRIRACDAHLDAPDAT